MNPDIANLSLSLVAILISLISLVESFRAARAGQTAVLIAEVTNDDDQFVYEIKNKGNGPAFFNKVEYFSGEATVSDTSFGQAIRAALREAGLACRVTTSEPATENVMAPGESIILVRLKFSADQRAKLDLLESKNFGIRISYRAALGGSRIFVSDQRLSKLR